MFVGACSAEDERFLDAGNGASTKSVDGFVVEDGKDNFVSELLASPDSRTVSNPCWTSKTMAGACSSEVLTDTLRLHDDATSLLVGTTDSR